MNTSLVVAIYRQWIFVEKVLDHKSYLHQTFDGRKTDLGKQINVK